MASASNITNDAFPCGSTVPFPFEHPYPQQTALMDAMLKALERKQRDNSKGAAIMLLESPTGTGKSLSLACAAMAWLRHTEQADFSGSNEAETKPQEINSGIDWLDSWVSPEETERIYQEKVVRQRAHEFRSKLKAEITALQNKLAPDNLRERRENLVRSAVTTAKMSERKVTRTMKKYSKLSKREDYCVGEYRSDAEDRDSDLSDTEMGKWVESSDLSSILDGRNLDGSSATHGTLSIGHVQPGSGYRKIIYAARTHSQLSQFVGELRRTYWGKDVRVVALGGRQVLCGNATINKKGRSEASISEACLDLQKEKNKCCPLKISKEAISTLALHMVACPSDIEDSARLGQASHTCAYYASREALATAEVVVMPYSMLLSKAARTAVGLSLKKSLVLVDEAHNLPEAIRTLHSSRLNLPVTEVALEQLTAYTQRYASRLTGRNLYYLGQIRKCLLAFIRYLKSGPSQSRKMMSSGELLIELKLDNVNIFKIIRYLEHSRLPQKLLGFTTVILDASKELSSAPGENTLSKHVSALSVVQGFLEKLTSTTKEGKVVTDRPAEVVDTDSRSRTIQHPTLRFVLLHPAAHFQNVLDEAHGVALVGGTLKPFAHVAAELLGIEHIQEAAKADNAFNKSTSTTLETVSETLTTFACDHVVPSSNIRLECMTVGPTNQKLDFRHTSRTANVVCDELGRAILQVCMKVPSGMVVFLPSYSYETHLVRRWKATGIWQDFLQQKSVYREPKSSQQVEAVLDAYSRDAQSKGAILLSVVGGKMSEGINFANDMARCVMVVGLPYPDITDPELKEKMANMDQNASHFNCATTGQAYYHNLCMRAVNQSVGRAIRHADDYAAIILADARYATDQRVWMGLPTWLRRDVCQSSKTFKAVGLSLDCFFGLKHSFTVSP